MNAQERLRRKAHHTCRHLLKYEHWDNCKIQYSHPHAYGLCAEMLTLGYDESQIKSIYSAELLKWHGIATDRGVVFKPSGLIADVRKALLAIKPKFDPQKYQQKRQAEITEQERQSEESAERFKLLREQYGCGHSIKP